MHWRITDRHAKRIFYRLFGSIRVSLAARVPLRRTTRQPAQTCQNMLRAEDGFIPMRRIRSGSVRRIF
jgi:hypothetical protein